MGSPKIHRCHSFDQRCLFNVHLQGYISKIHTIYLFTTNNNYFKLLRTYKFSFYKSILISLVLMTDLEFVHLIFFKVLLRQIFQ